MVVQVIACEFVHKLRAAIGMDGLAETIRRNRHEPDRGIHHIHDFCDAHEIMLDAFKEVTGRIPAFLEKPEAPEAGDFRMFDEAWALAMKLLEQELR